VVEVEYANIASANLGANSAGVHQYVSIKKKGVPANYVGALAFVNIKL
jgi:hypothetical protein